MHAHFCFLKMLMFYFIFKAFNFLLIHLFIFFWPCCVARGILVPQSGIEPVLPCSLSHWTTREVLHVHF